MNNCSPWLLEQPMLPTELRFVVLAGDNFVEYDTKSTSLAKDTHTDSLYLKTNMAFAANKLQLFAQNKIEPKIQESSTDEATKECLSICNEVYSSAVDALQKGLEDIKVGDFSKANFDMSAFMNDIDTCSECSSELDDPELQKFEDWIKGVGDDCFEKIAKYSTFSMNNLV